MRSFSSRAVLSLLPRCLLAALMTTGCSADDADDVTADDDLVAAPATLTLSLAIADSKVVFGSRTESFAIKGARALDLRCRDRAFHLTSKESLYAAGWSPEQADAFSEQVDGARFHAYSLASCRDATTQVLAWFPKEREYELRVSEQLLDEDYDANKLPLVLQLSSIGSAKRTYYSCEGAFSKKLVSESENAKRFDIGVECKRRGAPTRGELGPIDFITNPGRYAAIASYKPWLLPAVPSTKESFERVRDALLAKVAGGTYSGAMSTLGKTCELSIEQTADGLVVDHTIQSSQRTRHLELQAADLLGYVEGDLYEDPIRVGGEPSGSFAAAEFRDAKGGSFVVRFEQNSTLDAKIVRINGPEAYCRRLASK